MDLSDLEITYDFQATPKELETVGEIEDVVVWFDYTLTARATYDGVEYEWPKSGDWRLSNTDDIQESYDIGGDASIVYDNWAANFTDVDSVTSSKIMSWCNWNSPQMQSVKMNADHHLKLLIQETLETQEESEASITFVD